MSPAYEEAKQKMFRKNDEHTKQMRKNCRCDYSTIYRKCENKIIVFYGGLWTRRLSAAGMGI